MNKVVSSIINELSETLEQVSSEELSQTAEQLANAERIFVFGEGRSGFMAKAFAMRLMHLGAAAFVIGETTTPALQRGDCVVLVSGSGTTKSVVWTSEKANELGCYVIAFTASLQSPLAGQATKTVYVPAATKYKKEGEKASIQPLGSLFDQSMHILFDALCFVYSKAKQKSHEETLSMHSNVE